MSEVKSDQADMRGTWADDYDLFDPEYRTDPPSRWVRMRASCPVAHSDLYGGSWMPVRYGDIVAIATDTNRFSSRAVEVTGPVPERGGGLVAPPMTSDPPEHQWHRRLLLPLFSDGSIAKLEPFARSQARTLIRALVDEGEGDAIADIAQQLPMAVICKMMGVPAEDQPKLFDWVMGLMRPGEDYGIRTRAIHDLLGYFREKLAERRVVRADDLMSFLLDCRHAGEPLTDEHVIGSCFILILAGIDTTWSAIGSALWHLATHPGDQAHLVEEPASIPPAVEELLRFYAPATMARVVIEETELHGRTVRAGERVLLPFPAANHDPDAFEQPDVVDLDRHPNRHVTFGAGIHRCLGANLARMELRVTLEEWVAAVSRFGLGVPADAVEWTGGQVRGPVSLPIMITDVRP